MYSTIAKHILYPIGEAFLGTTMLKYLKELEKSQWWSPSELRELQDRKLRALIKHAYKNVPYYHHVFKERRLTDKDIQTAEDLQKLPILTKDDIRKNFDNLVVREGKGRKPLLNATSGSTGEPLKYYIDMEVASIAHAGSFRGWGWAGYKLGDKRATLAGSSIISNKRLTYKDRIRSMVERNLGLSAFDMDRERMSLYAKKLKDHKPKFLRGYASAIYIFANYLREMGINDIRPEAIFTTAEMLLPYYRKVIEKQFGCKVFDQYGCYDGGPQAMECPAHNGFHISVEKVILEFVDEDGNLVSPETSGDIITTDLHNYSMPFIRYAVGDKGALSEEQCPCGRGLPLMKSLEGRVSDFIVTPEGNKIHGEFFSHILFETPCIVQFQVLQESQNALLIKLVPQSQATKMELNKEEQRISDIIRMRTGSMDIKIHFVDEIPTTKAGKHKFIISKVS